MYLGFLGRSQVFIWLMSVSIKYIKDFRLSLTLCGYVRSYQSFGTLHDNMGGLKRF